MAAQSPVPAAQANTNNTPDQVFKVIQPLFGDGGQTLGLSDRRIEVQEAEKEISRPRYFND